MAKSPKQRTVAIDLFCGAGGLSYGLRRAGIEIRAGIDIDPVCEYPFVSNVKSDFFQKDISRVDGKFIKSLFPKKSIQILAGCAPCQPYSSYSRNKKQDMWFTLSKFGKLVNDVRPDIITMENVPGLTQYPVFKKYLRILDKLNYDYDFKIVNCAGFGVPQSRRRLVLLASKYGKINVMNESYSSKNYYTVRETISHLERIKAGRSSKFDRLHRSSSMTSINMKRIRSSTQGGTWRDWESKLRAKCHKKNTGATYGGVYGRMSWDKPSPTITTQFYGFGNGRFGHPRQNRAISLREGAMLQTFPEKYKFVPKSSDIHFTRIGRLIGNAVPVKLGAAIGRCIMSHLRENEVYDV